MEEKDNQSIIAEYMEKDAAVLSENGLAEQKAKRDGEGNGPSQESGMPKNSFWKFTGAFLAIIVLGIAAMPFISKYIDKQQEQARQDQYATNGRVIQDLQDRLKNDKDGGATAEETLKLFIAALKKGDIEQADKYFVFEPLKQQQRLIGTLKNVQEKGKLNLFIEYLGKANIDKEMSSDGNISFGYINRIDRTGIDIQITQSKYSTIWKIENLTF